MLRNRIKLTRTFRACFGGLAAALLAFGPLAAYGEAFQLPADGSDLIGEVRYVRARHEDTLIDIARNFSVGQEEMTMANPTVDTWLPGEGTQVVLPRQFILPDAPRAGIVVNVPEMRLYFYPVQYATVTRKKSAASTKTKAGAKGKTAPPKAPGPVTEVGEPISRASQVITYPVSMGRMDWNTPLGKTRIAQKVKDPVWIPPASIKREHALKGDILPDVVPAGPNNPLGAFAMKLGVAGYLIHGTESADKTKPFGIGMRVTHGCMRMYNEDVAQLFPQVAVGTPVYLVNQPIKLGWQGGTLYLEASQPLDEDVGIPTEWGDDALDDSDWSKDKIKEVRAKKAAMKSAYLLKLATNLIGKESARHPMLQLDDAAMRSALAKPSGIPVAIGRESLSPMEAAPGQYLPDRQTPVQDSSPQAGQYGSEPYTPPSAPRAPVTDPYTGQPAPGRYTPQQPASRPYAPPSIPTAPATDPYTGQPAPGQYTPQQPASRSYGVGQYNQPRAIPGRYGAGGYNQPRTAPGLYGAGQAAPGQYAPPPAPGQYDSGQAAPQSQYPQYDSEGYDQPRTAPGQYEVEQAAPEQYATPPASDPYPYPSEQYDTIPGTPSRPAPGAYVPDPYVPAPYTPGRPMPNDPYAPNRSEPAPAGPDPYAQ
jgi:L,D-transpeptidase ErfK/SrfK